MWFTTSIISLILIERWQLAAATPADTDPVSGVKYHFETYLPR